MGSGLARAFSEEYDEDLHRIFWQGNPTNREQFRINEFLFDVMVCSVSSVESLQRQSNRLEFIDQCTGRSNLNSTAGILGKSSST